MSKEIFDRENCAERQELILTKLRQALVSMSNPDENIYKKGLTEDFLKEVSSSVALITNSEGAVIYINDKKESISGVESHGDSKKAALALKFIKSGNYPDTKNIFSNSDFGKASEYESIKSVAYEKITKDSENIGYIAVFNADGYIEDDLKLLDIFADLTRLYISIYVKNRKMIDNMVFDRDLEIISNQQKLIMEDELIHSDEMVYADYINVPYKYVGGDFCKFQKVAPKKYFLFMADVMGHGIVSNYFVAMLKGALNTLLTFSRSPASIMTRLNSILFKELDKMNVFITAKAVVFDFEKERLYSSNAGHTFPVVIKTDEAGLKHHEILVSDTHIALGIIEDFIFQEDIYDMKNMKLFAIFTDGVTETKDKNMREFGIDKLTDYLERQMDINQSRVCEGLTRELQQFSGSDKASDDITMFTVLRK